VDHIDQLRRLAINDTRFADDLVCRSDVEVSSALDQKTLALVRIAALVGVGGAQPSFGALSDAAVDAGATAEEIVAVLVGVARVVGLPRVVAAAPNVAIALGYDVEEGVQ
jgi:alkylhydroperoxidase/carboxymuconolactone decarboxylase family protein YurZ